MELEKLSKSTVGVQTAQYLVDIQVLVAFNDCPVVALKTKKARLNYSSVKGLAGISKEGCRIIQQLGLHALERHFRPSLHIFFISCQMRGN